MPNLYPAFARQEVAVHTPRHVRSVAELANEELALVAEAWRRRRGAVPDGYLHALVNEGRDAGASLPHTHSQLVWLRKPPPEVALELPRLTKGDCALCGLTDELEISLQGGVSLRVASAGRVPYELLIVPGEHAAEPSESELGEMLVLLREAIRRLHELEGPVPLNAWLHTGAHWHLEIVPRLTVLAGLELGAGLYVNWLPPEEAAEALRAFSV